MRKERRSFAPLSKDLSTMCAKLVKDNLTVRIWSKPRTSIPKGFDSHAHYYYHMDVSGHKTENCWALKHKIQYLIDKGVIIIAC